MKCAITETGIRLTPETEFDKQVLTKLARGVYELQFENKWDREGDLFITTDHPSRTKGL